MEALEQMGVLGYMDPFTALNIKGRMVDGGVPDATLDQVNTLWAAYQDAILEKKLQPFTKDAEWIPTFEDLVKVTQLPKMTVSAFLTALRAHAADNATMQYLDPAQGQASRTKAIDTAKAILAAPGNMIKTAAKPLVDTAGAASDAISGPLKWVALAALAGAVIYVTFQLAPVIAGAKKARKKKG
jgi:hypothetical protein